MGKLIKKTEENERGKKIKAKTSKTNGAAEEGKENTRQGEKRKKESKRSCGNKSSLHG